MWLLESPIRRTVMSFTENDRVSPRWYGRDIDIRYCSFCLVSNLSGRSQPPQSLWRAETPDDPQDKPNRTLQNESFSAYLPCSVGKRGLCSLILRYWYVLEHNPLSAHALLSANGFYGLSALIVMYCVGSSVLVLSPQQPSSLKCFSSAGFVPTIHCDTETSHDLLFRPILRFSSPSICFSNNWDISAVPGFQTSA